MVVVHMAGCAANALGCKTLVCMALRAGDGGMFAQQREACQRMIECDLFPPAGRIVASVTGCAELAFVDIVIRVAACTAYRQFDDAWRLFVACAASQRLMRAAQGKAGHCVVIKAGLFPVATSVAARAVRAIAALVCIILDVASHTGPGRLSDRVGNAMARCASRRRMPTEQGKAGIRVVIK